MDEMPVRDVTRGGAPHAANGLLRRPVTASGYRAPGGEFFDVAAGVRASVRCWSHQAAPS